MGCFVLLFRAFATIHQRNMWYVASSQVRTIWLFIGEREKKLLNWILVTKMVFGKLRRQLQWTVKCMRVCARVCKFNTAYIPVCVYEQEHQHRHQRQHQYWVVQFVRMCSLAAPVTIVATLTPMPIAVPPNNSTIYIFRTFTLREFFSREQFFCWAIITQH